MYKYILFFLLVVVASACRIKLDGDNFYTIQGRLVDTLEQPIKNLKLRVITKQYIDFSYNEEIILNNATTDDKGYFQISFPDSNNPIYLSFEPDYYIYASSTNYFCYQINLNNSQNNLIDLKKIRLVKSN